MGQGGMRIACIGVGLIGRSWTVAFARAGHDVAIWDPKPEAITFALTAIGTALKDLREAGASFDPDEVRQRVCPANDIADAVSDVE